MSAVLIDTFVIFAVSVCSVFVGAYLTRRFDGWWKSRPLRQLLNFGPEDLVIVFAHRDEVPEGILPRTSTEDFMAMHNIISALHEVRWNRKIRIKDTSLFTEEDWKSNVVIICSPKSNDRAREFQYDLLDLSKLKTQPFLFDWAGQWKIVKEQGSNHVSPSFAQRQKYIAHGIPVRELPAQRYDDQATIMKITNPRNRLTKVLWVAGIRGVGTWGAAECLRKEWKKIYERLPRNNKNGDFSARLMIGYENSDIASTDPVDVVEL